MFIISYWEEYRVTLFYHFCAVGSEERCMCKMHDDGSFEEYLTPKKAFFLGSTHSTKGSTAEDKFQVPLSDEQILKRSRNVDIKRDGTAQCENRDRSRKTGMTIIIL